MSVGRNQNVSSYTQIQPIFGDWKDSYHQPEDNDPLNFPHNSEFSDFNQLNDTWSYNKLNYNVNPSNVFSSNCTTSINFDGYGASYNSNNSEGYNTQEFISNNNMNLNTMGYNFNPSLNTNTNTNTNNNNNNNNAMNNIPSVVEPNFSCNFDIYHSSLTRSVPMARNDNIYHPYNTYMMISTGGVTHYHHQHHHVPDDYNGNDIEDQSVIDVEGTSTEEQTFMESLRTYWRSRGVRPPKQAQICYKLFKAVEDIGGYEKMCEKRLWLPTAKRLFPHAKTLILNLSKYYRRNLLEFELIQSGLTQEEATERAQFLDSRANHHDHLDSSSDSTKLSPSSSTTPLTASVPWNVTQSMPEESYMPSGLTESCDGEEAVFMAGLKTFWRQRGITRFTQSSNKHPVNLYKLYKAVEEAGGYEIMCEKKLWSVTARRLFPESKSLQTNISVYYRQSLLEYELVTNRGLAADEAASKAHEMMLNKFKRKMRRSSARDNSGQTMFIQEEPQDRKLRTSDSGAIYTMDLPDYNNNNNDQRQNQSKKTYVESSFMKRFSLAPKMKPEFEYQIQKFLPHGIVLVPCVVADQIVDSFDIWRLTLQVDVTHYKGWQWVCRTLNLGDSFYTVCLIRNHFVQYLSNFRQSFSPKEKHKIQLVNLLDSRRTKEEYDHFDNDLRAFWNHRDNKDVSVPFVGGAFLDAFRLFNEVDARGGYIEVMSCKRWKEVGRSLEIQGKFFDSCRLKKFYEDFLVDYRNTLSPLDQISQERDSDDHYHHHHHLHHHHHHQHEQIPQQTQYCPQYQSQGNYYINDSHSHSF